jgi:hypothetical protein
LWLILSNLLQRQRLRRRQWMHPEHVRVRRRKLSGCYGVRQLALLRRSRMLRVLYERSMSCRPDLLREHVREPVHPRYAHSMQRPVRGSHDGQRTLRWLQQRMPRDDVRGRRLYHDMCARANGLRPATDDRLRNGYAE